MVVVVVTAAVIVVVVEVGGGGGGDGGGRCHRHHRLPHCHLPHCLPRPVPLVIVGDGSKGTYQKLKLNCKGQSTARR